MSLNKKNIFKRNYKSSYVYFKKASKLDAKNKEFLYYLKNIRTL